MPRPDPIQLVFEKERETKNKIRFKEANLDAKEGPVLEYVYLSKKRLKKMGDPEILNVTIQAP